MATIEQYVIQSELAQAAYGTFAIGAINPARLTSSDVGMSQTQAEHFAAEWSVIDQLPDTASGFSATIFKSNTTGKYSLAIRGSNQVWADFIASDFQLIVQDGVAARQLVDLYNFWHRSNTQAELV